MSSRQLTRSTSNRIIAGVAGGIAAYLGVDSGLTRLLVALVVIFTGIGPILYILAWIVLPEEGSGTTHLDSIIGSFRSRTQNSNPNPNDLR